MGRRAADRHISTDDNSREPNKASSSEHRAPISARSAAIRPPVPNGGLSNSIGHRAIEELPIDALKPNPRNARNHPPEQIETLIAGLRRFGFNGVILIDEHNRILAGHGRVEAAKRLGYTTIPCLRVTHLDAITKRAFALADNRSSELSKWDLSILKDELAELSLPDLSVIDPIGFDTVFRDALLDPEPDPRAPRADADGVSLDPDDKVLLLDEEERAISHLGDLWHLGAHAVICGSVLEPATLARLLDGESFPHMFTDPPYNVPIRGHVSAKDGFREFAMGSGEMPRPAFAAFLERFMRNASEFALNGAIFHVCMDWRHAEELLVAARAVELTLKNICVWSKPQAGMGTFYRSQHEFVFVFKFGDAPHINNFKLGQHGRYRTNVWKYASVGGRRKGVDAAHPTVKPVAMVVDAIKDVSKRGDIIFDPFAGSGTTAIAAERVGRRARLVEIDARYVDLIVRRFQAVTGKAATLDGDGRCFDEIAAARKKAARTIDDRGT